MATTYRVAQQTSQWCRFAAVTVEVSSWPEHEVSVAPDADENAARRREAELGAARALRSLPSADGRYRVTVTEIMATGADTGVGDVREATARAVWQAIGAAGRQAYTGFADDSIDVVIGARGDEWVLSRGVCLSGSSWLM